MSPYVWVGALAAIAIAASIAVSLGGDDATPVAGETAPAEAVGTPLPLFEEPSDAVGLQAPTISAQTITGERVQLLHDGPARLIGFFAHWCSHCQAELPRTVAWLAENELPAGVEFVAISTAVAPDRSNYPPSAWFEREGWPLPVLVDSDAGVLATAFGLSAFPYWVALDTEGRVVTRASSELTVNQFENLLALITPEA
jgi:thiol-disulfide isomerase/thioredoxin